MVPQHLHFALYVLDCYSVWASDTKAWAKLGKGPIELELAHVDELVALGLGEYRPVNDEGNRRVSTIRTSEPLRNAFVETFSTNPVPTHPGFWSIGDWTMETVKNYETDTTYQVPCLMSEYSEKLYVHSGGNQYMLHSKYKKGVRETSGAYCDAFFLATLRCVIYHEVYSAGHSYVKRIDGQRGYNYTLSSWSLYAMIRFGLIVVTQEYQKDVGPEMYGPTDLGVEFYKKALPYLEHMHNRKYWDQIADKMDWNDE